MGYNNKLNKYLYAAHPDAIAMGIYNVYDYAGDVDEILDTFDNGVVIDKDISNFGIYFDGEDLERGNYDILRYIQEKFNAYTGTKHYKMGTIDNVPLYVLKYPALYDGEVETSNRRLLPLPYLRHRYNCFESGKMNFSESNQATFPGIGVVHPSVVYGAYSRDFGGLVRSPIWSPVVTDIAGYTWSKKAYNKIKDEWGSEDILKDHMERDLDYWHLLCYCKEKGNRVSTRIDFQEVIDEYQQLFHNDIARQQRDFSEKEYYDRVLANWDVTKGLVPGNYSVETREF